MSKVQRGVVIFKEEVGLGWGTESWRKKGEGRFSPHCSSIMASQDFTQLVKAAAASRGPEGSTAVWQQGWTNRRADHRKR